MWFRPLENVLQLHLSCYFNHELIVEFRQGDVDGIPALSRELLLPFVVSQYKANGADH
jgi:hypothetical protein